MDKQALKLKLKLGANSTPDSSPKDHRMTEEDQMMGSDDEMEDDGIDDGQNDNMGEEDGATTRTRHGHHDDNTREKHKKSKKKKKKREREKEKERHKHRHHRDKNEGEEDGEQPAKKMTRSDEENSANSNSNSNSSDFGSQSSLNEVLSYLLDQLMKKDTQNFFTHPVTDAIAPGYSSIISQPMDFSKMKEKIAEEGYSTIPQFITDTKLICTNCMTYNQQDTIYFKTAKKLLHLVEKMLSKEKLISMRKEIPQMNNLTKDQLGFELTNEEPVAETTEPQPAEEADATVKETPAEDTNSTSKFEAIPDDMTPAEILEQASNSARDAAERLTQKKPDCTLGFLRQRGDGTTSLNFLIGCEGSDSNTKEKPVSLGLLTGKLTQGSASLHNYRDDKRNMAKPVKPLNYGSYSSFCPSYDSTFANLTKEESEMVYATYGNDTAVQYAESIMDFSRNCDTATYLVDQLLNLLTHQQHSRTQSIVEERRKLQEEEERMQNLIPKEEPVYEDIKTEAPKDDIDFTSLKGLSQLGIDTSFLSYFESVEQKNRSVKQQLDQNAMLLEDLSKTQKERLSKPLPTNLNKVSQPSNAEIELVEKVTEGLATVARQVPPGSLAPVPIVRRALGITMVPVGGDSNEHIDV